MCYTMKTCDIDTYENIMKLRPRLQSLCDNFKFIPKESTDKQLYFYISAEYENYNVPSLIQIEKILTLYDTVFIPNRFVHGDFACNKILFNPDNDLQISRVHFSNFVETYDDCKYCSFQSYIVAENYTLPYKILILFDLFVYTWSVTIDESLLIEIYHSKMSMKYRFIIMYLCTEQHKCNESVCVPATYHNIENCLRNTCIEKFLKNANITNKKLVNTYNNMINLFTKCNDFNQKKTFYLNASVNVVNGKVIKHKKGLLNEKKMYNYMNERCNNFQSFDTFNESNMIGIYNPSLIIFGKFHDPNIKNYIIVYEKIFAIFAMFRKHNFFHGDLHSNNILIDRYNFDNIQIIDLEMSMIMNEENVVLNDCDTLLSIYTDVLKVSRNFMFLFDMYVFVVTHLRDINANVININTYTIENIVTFDYIILHKIFACYDPKIFTSHNKRYNYTPISYLINFVVDSTCNFNNIAIQQRYEEIKEIMHDAKLTYKPWVKQCMPDKLSYF